MKSTPRAARSRTGGYRLDTLRELVIAPIIYLGPLVVGAAPLLLLYGLYRPTVLMNPGLSALKAPAAMAMSLRTSQPESREDVGTSNQAAFAVDQPQPADKKPEGRSGPAGSHPIAGRRDSRLAGSARRPAPAHNVSAGVNNPGWYTGTSRSPASAYAYADQSGRYRW